MVQGDDPEQAQAARRAREQLRSEALRIAQVGTWTWDPQAGAIAWSDEASRILGAGPEASRLTPGAFLARLEPEDRPAIEAWARACAAGERTAPLDFRIVRPDGTRRVLQGRGGLLEPEGGRPGLVGGTVQDVTEARQAGEALRRSEERLRDAQRVARVGSWSWNVQTDQLEWSEEMYRIFGVPPAATPGRLAEVVARAIHPDDRAAVELVNRQVLEEGRPAPLEYRVCRPDGSVRTVWAEAGELRRDASGRPLELSGIVKDVTDQRRAQQELGEREALFRGLVEHAPDVIYAFSSQRGGTYYSPRVEQVLGYPPQHLLDHPLLWQESIHEEDRPRVAAAVRDFLAGGEFEVEYRIRDRQGRWRWLLDRSIGRGVGSGVTTIYGMATDITERMRVERSQRSQKRLQRVLTGCSEAVARAATERELLDAVCRQVVAEGDYRLCWIGWLQDDERRTIRPAARAGQDDGFIEALDAVWRDGQGGDTLASRAAATGRLTVRREAEAGEASPPWPEAARQRGFRAACALPLGGLGDVDGVLSIYADDADAFGDDERPLLERLAGTVAFGVAARRARAEQVRAEAELRRSREELRALAARLDSVREEEKSRISRDLHDDVGQLLTALRLDLDEILARVEALPVTAANGQLLDRVVDAGQLVARAVQATRHAVTLLRPAALDRLGLEAALRQECAAFEARTGTPCAAELSGAEGLGADGEIALFRITQEALTNVVRHARARHVRVQLTREQDGVVLRVVDDGVGPAGSGTTGRGLGIVGMRERALRIGGTFDVEPGPAGGTAVTARVPLHGAGVREEAR